MFHHHQPRNEEQKGSIAFLLSLPILLVALPFLAAGYYAAKKEVRYAIVKALIYPVSFVLSMFSAGLLFMCFGWLFALLGGSTHLANYVMGNTSELVLLSTVFGDPITVPHWHVIVFQIVVWLFIGRRLARHLAFSIYDFAIQYLAQREAAHPYYVRERIIKYDPGYAKAYAFYQKTGKPPLLGLILVGISPTPIAEFY